MIRLLLGHSSCHLRVGVPIPGIFPIVQISAKSNPSKESPFLICASVSPDVCPEISAEELPAVSLPMPF